MAESPLVASLLALASGHGPLHIGFARIIFEMKLLRQILVAFSERLVVSLYVDRDGFGGYAS